MDPSFRGRTPNVPYSNRPRGRFHLSPRGLLVGGLLLAGLITGAILLSSSGDNTLSLQQHLSARLGTLQKMTDEGEKTISDDDLREFNGRLRIQLSSDAHSIGEAMGVLKTDKTIIADEADTASFDSLKDARLNSRFDAAYRKLITQKLDSTTLLMKELYDKTSSKKLKNALDSAYRNFKQLETQLTTSS